MKSKKQPQKHIVTPKEVEHAPEPVIQEPKGSEFACHACHDTGLHNPEGKELREVTEVCRKCNGTPNK